MLVVILFVYLCFFGVFAFQVYQFPFLGIKLSPIEEIWKVDSLMASGIGKEIGINKGDVVVEVDGGSSTENFIIKKWLILEQANSITISRLGKTSHIDIEYTGRQNLAFYFIMVLFSLVFLGLGIMTFYKRHYYIYSKYFLLFNISMASVLLAAVPSNLGYLSARIMFCFGLIWMSFFLIKFIMYFPKSIVEFVLVRNIGRGFFLICSSYSLLVLIHLFFEMPMMVKDLLIKGIMTPALLSLLAVSLLLGFVTKPKVNKREQYQVNILLLCSLLGYLPTIVFYMIPTILKVNEVSFVSTTFFLALLPIACAYIMLKNGKISIRYQIPNSIITFFYAFIVVIAFYLFYRFQDITGHMIFIFFFSFFFFFVVQSVYQSVISWNTNRSIRDKNKRKNESQIINDYEQSTMMYDLIQLILEEMNRLYRSSNYIVISTDCYVRHSLSNKIDSQELHRINVNKKGELIIRGALQVPLQEIVPLLHGDEKVGYLLIFGTSKSDDRSFIQPHVQQLTNIVYFISQYRKVKVEYERLLKKGKSNYSIEDDYHLIENIEEEKEKISQYLHDTVIQNIIFVLRDLKENVGTRKGMEQMVESLENTLYDLRNLCFDLYPAMVEDVGFKKAVHYLIREVQINTDVVIMVEYEMFVEKNLSVPIKVATFRIIKELVNNVIKHARAKKAMIFISMDEDVLLVKVVDDGIGFVKKIPEKKSFGLYSIKRKVESLRGTFHVSSNQGSGTTITVSVPISLRGE